MRTTFHLEVLQVLLCDDGGLAQLAEEADPHVPLQAAFASDWSVQIVQMIKIYRDALKGGPQVV